MKKITILFIFLLALGMFGCGGKQTGGKKFTIAVVPKGTTHPFWKSVNAGAVKAANDAKAQGADADLIWKGPLREDDREQQIQVVEGFVSQGVSSIVLAPLDSKALIRPVEEAKRVGIPTVIMDSGLETEQITSFAATDNRKGGNLAGERLGELLGGKGKVIMLRYLEGSASTTDREEGFLEVIKAKFPNIELISTDQYAGATRDSAKRTAENLLQRFGDEVNGVFASNEPATTIRQRRAPTVMRHLLGRMGTIEEAGKLCLFIATEATFTTGVDHILSGGAELGYGRKSRIS